MSDLHFIVKISGYSTLFSKMQTNASSSPSEIKEEIKWLHYETINLLSTTSYTDNSWNTFNNNQSSSNNVKYQNFNFSNSNILLILGYKTGFSIWTIDVSIKYLAFEIGVRFGKCKATSLVAKYIAINRFKYSK